VPKLPMEVPTLSNDSTGNTLRHHTIHVHAFPTSPVIFYRYQHIVLLDM